MVGLRGELVTGKGLDVRDDLVRDELQQRITVVRVYTLPNVFKRHNNHFIENDVAY